MYSTKIFQSFSKFRSLITTNNPIKLLLEFGNLDDHEDMTTHTTMSLLATNAKRDTKRNKIIVQLDLKPLPKILILGHYCQ